MVKTYYPVRIPLKEGIPSRPYVLLDNEANFLGYEMKPSQLAQVYVDHIRGTFLTIDHPNFLSFTPPFDLAPMGGVMKRVFPLDAKEIKEFEEQVDNALHGR